MPLSSVVENYHFTFVIMYFLYFSFCFQLSISVFIFDLEDTSLTNFFVPFGSHNSVGWWLKYFFLYSRMWCFITNKWFILWLIICGLFSEHAHFYWSLSSWHIWEHAQGISSRVERVVRVALGVFGAPMNLVGKPQWMGFPERWGWIFCRVKSFQGHLNFYLPLFQLPPSP